MKQSPIKIAIAYLTAIILAMVFLVPFYVIARNALMTQREVANFDWILWAEEPQFENASNLFSDPIAPMGTGLRNSTIMSVVQVTGQLLLCSLAGYGLARIQVRYANLVFYFIMGALLVPSAAIFIQSFLVVASLGWVNTMQGLAVPGIFSAFTTFVFRQFFLSFPTELEDAGRVDGLGDLGIFFRIVAPNSIGIFIALGTLAFIRAWNSFLWPLVVGQQRDMWTVQVVISTFLTAQTIDLPAIFMGAAISVLPILMLFFVVQRYIVQGVTASGIKG